MESAPITSIQEQSFENILKLIPEVYKTSKGFEEYKTELFEEVSRDFDKSMKKSQGEKRLHLFSNV